MHELEILSNEYNEVPVEEYNEIHTNQKIVFQITEEDLEPDVFAFDILLTLSLLSFMFASPQGYSKKEFVIDEEWCLGYFLQGLKYEYGNLFFTSDYISGRMMKTDIEYESGGKLTISTRNRGKGAEMWVAKLQGKEYKV
jgi:hypothetical protein